VTTQRRPAQSDPQVGRAEPITSIPQREIIATDKAPAAIGPYSQGVRVGGQTTFGMVFTAGQIAIDPAAGKLIEGDIAAQTRQVLTNLSFVLQAADSSLERVVKTTVFLANMDDFAAMNAVYAEFFASDPPARSTVEVSRLPAGALVEIEAIAVVNQASP
jgi:2-iminobutanoate/2-iminopropanoate deaminase